MPRLAQERRLLQQTVGISAVLPIAAGLYGVLFGQALTNETVSVLMMPSTATNKVLKRELAAQGATAGNGVLWVREARGTAYSAESAAMA